MPVAKSGNHIYIEHKTKELTISIIFAALALVAKQYKIPIAPGIKFKFTGVFNYLPPTIVRLPFVWVGILVGIFDGGDPIKGFFKTHIGRLTTYFTSRVIPRKTMFWRVVPMGLGNFASSAVTAVYEHYMLMVPFHIGFPAKMVNAAIQMGPLFILAPPILKALDILGVTSSD